MIMTHNRPSHWLTIGSCLNSARVSQTLARHILYQEHAEPFGPQLQGPCVLGVRAQNHTLHAQPVCSVRQGQVSDCLQEEVKLQQEPQEVHLVQEHLKVKNCAATATRVERLPVRQKCRLKSFIRKWLKSTSHKTDSCHFHGFSRTVKAPPRPPIPTPTPTPDEADCFQPFG